MSSDLKLVYSALVDFDADLAHHGIKKGVLTNPAENEIFAPVAMWLEALDLVLSRLHSQGLDFGRVKGIAGAGMQHGTVFWGPNTEKVMGSLDSGKGLAEQLIGKSADGKWKDVQELGAFAHEHSPNWQDASTQKQCEEFDKCLGSPEKLAEVTGSKAHHVSITTLVSLSKQHNTDYLKSGSVGPRSCVIVRSTPTTTQRRPGFLSCPLSSRLFFWERLPPSTLAMSLE